MPDLQQYAALHAPCAPFTWSASARLENDTESSGVIPVRFPRAVEIVGMHASVRPVQPVDTDLADPTADDILCALEMNDEKRFTNQKGETASGSNFVVLASLSVAVPRLFLIQLEEGAQDFEVQFKWRQFTNGTELFNSALVELAFFCRYLDKR